MIYQAGDPYGRSRYNPLALRAMVIDKLRERMLGLIFVPDQPLPAGQQPTLAEILAQRVKGRLYDAYRQSWVASPEPDYVAAGNAPLRAHVEQLQAILDAPQATVMVKDKPVPTVASGLSQAERAVLESRGLLQGGRVPVELCALTQWVKRKPFAERAFKNKISRLRRPTQNESRCPIIIVKLRSRGIEIAVGLAAHDLRCAADRLSRCHCDQSDVNCDGRRLGSPAG